MNTGQLLTLVFPLALTSGINVYATVLIVGICTRLGWVAVPPPGWEVLGSNVVLAAAGVLYTLEFLADKIPIVDNFWDLLHTLIRPLGAAVLSYATLAQLDPQITALAGLATGSVALVAHGGKAGSRVALNVASPAENLSNILVSLAEDLGVAALTLLAMRYPVLAALVASSVFACIVVFVPGLVRWSWLILTALRARLAGLVHQVHQSDLIAPRYASLLTVPPLLAARSRAQKIKGAHGRSGFAILLPSTLAFCYTRWGRSRLWQIERQHISAAKVHRRALLDVLEVTYLDAQQRSQIVRLVFLKDRSWLLAQFAAACGAQMPPSLQPQFA